MRSQAALVVLSACVLHEQAVDLPTYTGTSSPAEPVDCVAPPPFDLPSLDCAQLSNAFESTLSAAIACNSPADCQLIAPRCETWGELSCYYAANYCVDPQQIEMFHAQAEGCSIRYEECDCGEEPAVDCVNRVCVLIETP